MDATLSFEGEKLCLKTAGRVDHDPLRGRRRESRGTAARAALTAFSHADGRGRKEFRWIGCKQREEQLLKQPKMCSPEIELKSSES